MKLRYRIVDSIMGFAFPSLETRCEYKGKAVIVRKRKKKVRPLEFKTGKVFKTVHCGLWSVSIEHKLGKPVYFNNIRDINGVEQVNES